MNLEQMKERMKREDFSVIDCVRHTGLHHNTIYRVIAGRAKRLNPLTVEALEKYFKKLDKVAK